MKGNRLNNEERRLWTLNDEGLYNWFRSTRLSMTKFIKENREEIDKHIKKALGRYPGDTQ